MKIIIFDMDDTLLNKSRKVSDFTLSTLRKVQELGHKIVINTARSKFYNQEYFDLIKPDYAILNGGSLIIDKNENVIFKLEIEKGETNKIIDELLNVAETFSIQTIDQLYSSDPNYKNQGSIYHDFSDHDFKYGALKIIVSIKNQEIAKDIAKKHGILYVPYFGGTFGRMNHKDATKEDGNKNLLKLLNINAKDSIVFGDDHGDINMINSAGVGVLMKNANHALYDKVKTISEYTNDEDGVAKFLIKYFDIK